MTQTQLAHPARRRRWRRNQTVDCAQPARVTLAWTAAGDSGAPSRPAFEVELVAAPRRGELGWLAELAAARCNEVVLTAHVGNDGSAKHLVLELAELLTLELTATQPLIRVLFSAEPSYLPGPEAPLPRPAPNYEDFSTIGAI